MTIERATLAALALLVLVLSIASVRLDTAVADEPAHLAAGFIKLLHGRLDFFREQPPLMNSLSAIPPVLAGYRMPPVWAPSSNHWEVGRYLLYRTGYDAHRILFLGRLPTILLFLMLCFLVYWFVARQTGSRTWGLVGFALVGLCPNLMAHGRLATVDLALAFFAFAATILFIMVIEQESVPAAIGTGVAWAGAVLSKTSGHLIGPYFVVVLLLAFGLKRVRNPRRVLLLCVVALIAGVVFAEALYFAMASPDFIAQNFPRLSQSPMGRLLVPFADLRENIEVIRRWYTRGAELPQFLLGEFSNKGWRHYYLVALLLKTTIPAILLVIFGVVALARRLRGNFATLVLFLFVAVFLGVASAGDLDLGLRYVLPIYPFLYAGTVIALAHAAQALQTRSRQIALGVVAALVVWHGAENAVAYPSYISYFNELIGGNQNADKFLIDSNLDWGTDLRRLQIWARANGVKEITIHYFGGGDPAYEFRDGPRAIVLYDIPPELPRGWFAVSRHFQRLSYAPVFPIDYGTLLERANAQYVTTIGGSINVYRID